jgi:hypothetical protein
MRSDLDHLPDRKRRDLERVVEISPASRKQNAMGCDRACPGRALDQTETAPLVSA